MAARVAVQPKTFTLDYDPRPHFIPFHQRTTRWACMVCHRRAGKTVACVNDLVLRSLYTKKKNARYSYIAPTFTQAKDIAWQYLKDAVAGIAVAVRESELRVILPNNAWITLYGSDNPDRLRGIYNDGIIVDEYGDCRPNLWGEILLPTLLDRDGWAVFIGTSKGKNHFYRTYERARRSPEWYVMRLSAEESGILSEKQLSAIKAESTKEEYEQEMLCSFTAAVRGTYYADLIASLEQKGNIKPQRLYDPNQKVCVASDLGFADSTAFWFWQPRPDGLAVFDYFESQGKSLAYYFDLLDGKGYDYEQIWLPHDAKAKTLQTGRSTIEQFLARGYPCSIAPTLALQHGIDAVRKVLPRCWIDSEKCYLGVENLRAYRRRWDEVNQCFANTPLHDFASDGADSFRYLSLVAQEGKKIQNAPTPTLPRAAYSLDDLFQLDRHKLPIEKLRI